MEYRQLGNSGLTVSLMGLGTNNFGTRLDQQQASAVVSAAIDHGITFIDTAELYGNGKSEEMIGNALRGNREKVVLATKFGHGRTSDVDNAPGSRRNMRIRVERSLKRLQTDYIDLYYLHTPDPLTPIAETLYGLTELIDEGKVRYIATCNLDAWQVVEAEWTARANGTARFIASQNPYNLIDRQGQDELLPALVKYGIGFVPYYPLAQGLLTGKFKRGAAAPLGTRLADRAGGISDAEFDKIEPLEAYAQERGISLLEVALGGLAAEPGVSTLIASASRPEQIEANVKACAWKPSAEDFAALKSIT